MSNPKDSASGEPWFAPRARLYELSRPGALRAPLAQVIALMSLGAAASLLVSAFKLKLQLPGHHLALIMPVLALGLALAPRRGAGIALGAGALGAGAFFGAGFGALTSTALAGIGLEWTASSLERRPKTSPWLAFASAGLIINSLAFLSRASVKVLGPRGPGDLQAWSDWWPRAALSYPFFGLLAGLLAACLLSRRAGTARPAASGDVS